MLTSIGTRSDSEHAIDKSAPWGKLNIQEVELCVKGILANLGVVF